MISLNQIKYELHIAKLGKKLTEARSEIGWRTEREKADTATINELRGLLRECDLHVGMYFFAPANEVRDLRKRIRAALEEK